MDYLRSCDSSSITLDARADLLLDDQLAGKGRERSPQFSAPFFLFFFFNDTATTEIYTLSLHDALPIYWRCAPALARAGRSLQPRKSFPPPSRGTSPCTPRGWRPVGRPAERARYWWRPHRPESDCQWICGLRSAPGPAGRPRPEVFRAFGRSAP